MLTLTILLVPSDIQLILHVWTRLVAREDALPVVAIAPPVVAVAWKDRTILGYHIETGADLQLEFSRTRGEVGRCCCG